MYVHLQICPSNRKGVRNNLRALWLKCQISPLVKYIQNQKLNYTSIRSTL